MAASEIEGYNEFQRDTKKIERDFPKALQDASFEIAQEWVAAATTAANTQQASIAAQALMVGQSTEGAEITNDSPLFFGSEFGGQARPETMQFPPHNGRKGYWFYPARRANEDRFMAIWDKGVEQAMIPWNRRG